MDYSDIIDHPRYEPVRHPRMPLLNRSVIFAPFSALSDNQWYNNTEGTDEVHESKEDEDWDQYMSKIFDDD